VGDEEDKALLFIEFATIALFISISILLQKFLFLILSTSRL
jgi:hypothetical protein